MKLNWRAIYWTNLFKQSCIKYRKIFEQIRGKQREWITCFSIAIVLMHPACSKKIHTSIYFQFCILWVSYLLQTNACHWTRGRQCFCLGKACNVSFRPGIVPDARSRGHRVCTANVRGMRNNVSRRRRVSRPPAHPRRRCSPVSRESKGRPLVKMLLFTYGSREGLDLLLSSRLRSTPMTFVWERNEERVLRNTRLKQNYIVVLLFYHCFI